MLASALFLIGAPSATNLPAAVVAPAAEATAVAPAAPPPTIEPIAGVPEIPSAASPPTIEKIAPAADPVQEPAGSPQDAIIVPAPIILSPKQGATPSRQHTPGDPLEGFNRKMFGGYQSFDKAVLRPVALGYKHVIPKPVRSGFRNALSNVGEPIVFLNFLLEFKIGKAVKTLGRFAINSTLGLGGLIDVAKTSRFRLPHRPNGFGDMLGFYGVKPGPYLFLPLVGPTTLRDLLGGQADGLVLARAVGEPFDRWDYAIGTGVISGIDQRAESDDELKALFDGALDPYATLRSVYLQDRQGEIDELRGKHVAATPELGEPLDDPLGSPTPATTANPAELRDPLTEPADSQPLPSVTAENPEPPNLADPLIDPAPAKP